MASTKDLAGLAALGALGYMMSQQGNKVDLNQPESSGDSNPNRGAGYNSTETRLNTPDQSIAAADQSSKGSISTRGDSGVTTPGPASAPNLDYTSAAPVSQKTPAAPTAKTKAVRPQAKPSQQNLPPANKSSASTASSKPVDDTNYSNEGRGAAPNMNISQPTTAPATKPMPAGAKFVPGFGMVDADGNIIPRGGPSGPSGPDDGFLGKNFRKALGSSYKKGGETKVKKMAKGGLTSSPSSASSRGDGIASRGKTRGKIY
jgi:hypothetical protein